MPDTISEAPATTITAQVDASGTRIAAVPATINTIPVRMFTPQRLLEPGTVVDAWAASLMFGPPERPVAVLTARTDRPPIRFILSTAPEDTDSGKPAGRPTNRCWQL